MPGGAEFSSSNMRHLGRKSVECMLSWQYVLNKSLELICFQGFFVVDPCLSVHQGGGTLALIWGPDSISHARRHVLAVFGVALING